MVRGNSMGGSSMALRDTGDFKLFGPTKAITNIIVKAVEQGNYILVACRLAGIRVTTYKNWMERGLADDSGKYFDFYEAVMEAEARFETSLVAQIKAQIPESWQAGMTLLERRFPQRWGRRDRMEHSFDVMAQAKLLAEKTGLPEAEIIAEAERLMKEQRKLA